MTKKNACSLWLREHVNDEDGGCLIWPFARHVDGRAKINGDMPARQMCEIAHGPAPTPLHEAAHSCGKAHLGCVHPKHLRWATRAENHADKREHGTHLEGEKHYRAILTENDVVEIRRLRRTLSQRRIARRYGVSRSCISGVLGSKNWKHVQ